MCRNEFDANRYLAYRPAAPVRIVKRRRTVTRLTPAGIFWLHYLALYAIVAACAYFFWV